LRVGACHHLRVCQAEAEAARRYSTYPRARPVGRLHLNIRVGPNVIVGLMRVAGLEARHATSPRAHRARDSRHDHRHADRFSIRGGRRVRRAYPASPHGEGARLNHKPAMAFFQRPSPESPMTRKGPRVRHRVHRGQRMIRLIARKWRSSTAAIATLRGKVAQSAADDDCGGRNGDRVHLLSALER